MKRQVKSLNKEVSLVGKNIAQFASVVAQKISIERHYKSKDGTTITDAIKVENLYVSGQPQKHNAIRSYPAEICSDNLEHVDKSSMNSSKTVKYKKSSAGKQHVCETNEKPTQSRHDNENKTLKYGLILFGSILLGVFIKLSFFTENPKFETDDLIRDLEMNIYGQQEVISKMKISLNDIDKKTLYVFTGGIGVGKTYTSQIILKRFPLSGNIQKIHPINLKKFQLLRKVNYNLNKSDFNMIVVDDLEPKELPTIIPVVNDILALKDYNIFVILIVNVQELSIDMVSSINVTQETQKIKTIFTENGIYPDIFIFNSLDEDSVKKCIQHTMKVREMKITDESVHKILEEVHFKYSGCKGVYSKVALLNKST